MKHRQIQEGGGVDLVANQATPHLDRQQKKAGLREICGKVS